MSRYLWLAVSGLVAGLIGLTLIADAVGRDPKEVLDTVGMMIESLGLNGGSGFRLQGLVGTFLLVLGLSLVVFGATRTADSVRKDRSGEH